LVSTNIWHLVYVRLIPSHSREKHLIKNLYL
jgi:hypothetical protein